MRTIDDLLRAAPAFAGLGDAHRELIARCARNEVFEPGAFLMREDEPATSLHLVRAGSLAVEIHLPQHGAIVIETLHEGDLAGWSWLVAPYRTQLDVRAATTTHTVSFDGTCLRARCDADPVLGYALLRLLTPVIVERLNATRLRLLDLYGHAPIR